MKVVVERELNLLNFGVPLWLYRFRLTNQIVVDRRREPPDWFFLWNPARWYYNYDTKEIPGSVYRVYRYGCAGGAGDEG
jgi:hypothetical protein